MKTTEFVSSLLGERYTRTELACGLPIYVFPKELTSAHVLFAVKYGSMDSDFVLSDRNETVHTPDGIAHFLEHKLFENEDGSDSFARFAELGAEANAYTDYDKTAYLFSCTERFDEALEELLRFVTHPYFTAATVRKERGIIAEEIRMYRDNPWDRAARMMLESMYAACPIRNDICGTEASIGEITPELLYDCHRAFYNPQNMVLAVCGNVTAEEVAAIAERALPKDFLPRGIERVTSPEPHGVVSDYAETRMQVAKPIFNIGAKDRTEGMSAAQRLRRDACMALLGEILFSQSGAFYNELFESGLISPSFSAEYFCNPRYAYHCFGGESDTPEEVLAALKSLLSRVKREGLDPEDFERCRRVLYADEIRAYDSTEEIASRMLSFVMEDFDMFEMPALFQSITREEVEDVLRDAFADDCFTLSVVRPQGG